MYDEYPEAGDEWTAKAMLMGVELVLDNSYGALAPLWAARIPPGKFYYGVTQARACRKLVRAVLREQGALRTQH